MLMTSFCVDQQRLEVKVLALDLLELIIASTKEF